MSNVSAMLRGAREAAGVSARALARRAGVSASTVIRIESGAMEPTVAMLERLLAAAGQRLMLSLEAAPPVKFPQLADLSDAWIDSPMGDRPDWTRLRMLLDDVLLHPEQVRAVIARAPSPSGSPMLDALLAGVADKLADDHRLRRPAWTKAAGRFLASIWETPGTPRMKQAARDRTPPQLLAHGVVASQDSLWRDSETLGLSSGV